LSARRAGPPLWLVAGVLLAATTGCSRHPAPLVRRPGAPATGVVITDTAVLDVASGTVAAGRDVLIAGDRITAVVPTGSASPPGAVRVDGRGATVVPGLIDLHAHIGANPRPSWLGGLPDPDVNLQSFLYCGITTVLDPGDLSSEAFARRDRVRRGELLAPTIFTAGPMLTATDGHPVGMLRQLAPWWIRWYLIPRLTIQVDTPEAARAAVQALAGDRPDVLKLAVDRIPDDAPRIRNDVLAAAVTEARRHGIRAVAHIGSVEDAVDAARAGVAAWMHGVYKERIPDARIPELAAFHIPMVVTMAVFESYATLGQGPRVPTPLERETVPADVLAAFDTVPQNGIDPSLQAAMAAMRELRPAWRDNVRRLRAAGVTILAGSDPQTGVFPGPALHRELALLTEAGLTPADAIRAATLDAARFLAGAAAPDRGAVTPGLRADLLVVEGDPTRDVAALGRIRTLVLGGVPLERRALGQGSR
jgi:imidazolonepropionase-like amidohydrolase